MKHKSILETKLVFLWTLIYNFIKYKRFSNNINISNSETREFLDG